MDKEVEELLKDFESNLYQVKQQSEMAALLGSLGVHPKYMNMYLDSMNRIENFKSEYI